MREIEIKVRLRDKKGLLAALAAKGVVLSEPVHQRDQVLACREKLAVTAIQRLGYGCVPRRVDKVKMKRSGRYLLSNDQ